MSYSYADEIIPGLFIGSRRAIIGHDSDHHLFDVIISALTEEEYSDCMIDTPDFTSEQDWCRLVIDDEPYEDISKHFKPVHQLIDDAISHNKTVLVHCMAGISRSATLVAAYLILSRNITVADAIVLIKKRRHPIDPNEGFLRQLEELRSSLVVAALAAATATPVSDGFQSLSSEDTNLLINKIGDPLLTNTMKYIYECHGDQEGSLFYVSGFSNKDTYCVYKKIGDQPATIIEFPDAMEYAVALYEIDQEILAA
jgi:hypothetical protein